jgi:hypothetical protein
LKPTRRFSIGRAFLGGAISAAKNDLELLGELPLAGRWFSASSNWWSPTIRRSMSS